MGSDSQPTTEISLNGVTYLLEEKPAGQVVAYTTNAKTGPKTRKGTPINIVIHDWLNNWEITGEPQILMVAKIKVIAIFTSPDSAKTYNVCEGKDGNIYCTCMAWRMSQSQPKDCKHLKSIRDAVLTGDTSIFEGMNT